jgi:hypothetical protein
MKAGDYELNQDSPESKSHQFTRPSPSRSS